MLLLKKYSFSQEYLAPSSVYEVVKKAGRALTTWVEVAVFNISPLSTFSESASLATISGKYIEILVGTIIKRCQRKQYKPNLESLIHNGNSAPRVSILICPGCYNKMPQIEYLRQQKFISHTILGVEKFKIEAPGWFPSGKSP